MINIEALWKDYGVYENVSPGHTLMKHLEVLGVWGSSKAK